MINWMISLPSTVYFWYSWINLAFAYYQQDSTKVVKSYLIYNMCYQSSKLEMKFLHNHTPCQTKCHICNELRLIQGSKHVPLTSKLDNGCIRRFPHCLKSHRKYNIDATSNTRCMYRVPFWLKNDKLDDFTAFYCIFLIQLNKFSICILPTRFHQSGEVISYI